ncbi:MAG TPA: lipopolysaccharide heptosyltransferase II [Candidatus Binataceae bacterium]|nr:lipopolysaccharide heptosyltransferase II [Candidatus Binataceae bacterium]
MRLKPKRILVKEVNWLGDLVISLPALRSLRMAYPEAAVSVLVKHELTGFFDGMEWLAEVIPYRVRRGIASLSDQLAIANEIRQRRFDLAVLFPKSFASALWVTLAGVPRRIGYSADARSMLLTDRIRRPIEVMQGHQSGEWLALVRQAVGSTDREASVGARLGGSLTNQPLEVASKNRERMRGWLDAKRKRPDTPVIAIAPAAAYGPAKEWAPEHYGELIELISESYGAECVLIGGANERERCETIAAKVKKPVIVAAGETTIGELIALISLCTGFAGNDSGAMHLAAALGIPTAGIFGSTNPERTGPQGAKAAVIYHRIGCSPCLARTCRYGHYECLRGIAAAEVAETLARLGAFGDAD